MRKIIVKSLMATAILAAMCGVAAAEEAGKDTPVAAQETVITTAPETAQKPAKDWYIAVRLGYQPYQINAKGTALGRDFDSTASLSDIMDKTDTTIYGGELEFGMDKWFGTFAGFYQKSEVSKSKGAVGIDAAFKETGLNPMVGYHVYQTRLGEMPLIVDAMAGLFYVKVEGDVNIYVAGDSHPMSKDISFTDPMLGTRGYLALTKKLGVAASWQIGGFGLGSDVNTTVGGNVVYNFTNWFALSGGYKYWYFKYSDSGAPLSKLEQSLYGPVIGLQLKY